MGLHHWFRHRHEHRDAFFEHLRHWYDFGRHRHGGGEGEGDGGFGFGGMFGRRHGGGRMFGHGDLKLVLLALISEQPRHGYELIRTIEDMFQGSYAPSPGVVYPTLTLLEEMGYARIDSEESNRKRYAITDEGRAFLAQNQATVDAIMARMEMSARIAAKLAMPAAIRQAMHTLKHALLSHGREWTPAEALRVRTILETAAEQIARGPK